MSEETTDGAVAGSMTDLMTSLAIIFILLFVSTLNNQGDERKKKQTQTQNIVVADVSERLKQFRVMGVRVEPDERDPLIVRIITPEELLRFRLNDSSIPPGGRDFLVKFAPALIEAITEQVSRQTVAALVVEGHTDESGTDEVNLRLSQQRATAVSLYLLEILQNGPPALKETFVRIQSTAGRGSAEPISHHRDGNGEDEKNRRVVFKVRLRAPELFETAAGPAAVPGVARDAS